jgi:hypothetical protein
MDAVGGARAVASALRIGSKVAREGLTGAAG